MYLPCHNHARSRMLHLGHRPAIAGTDLFQRNQILAAQVELEFQPNLQRSLLRLLFYRVLCRFQSKVLDIFAFETSRLELLFRHGSNLNRSCRKIDIRRERKEKLVADQIVDLRYPLPSHRGWRQASETRSACRSGGVLGVGIKRVCIRGHSLSLNAAGLSGRRLGFQSGWTVVGRGVSYSCSDELKREA